MEFQNTNTNNRKKLCILSFVVFVLFSLSAFFDYYFAPPEYQTGKKHSVYWLSYDELIFAISSMSLFSIFIATYSKIILKIKIDEISKTLSIEVIERFKIKPKTYTFPLSKVKITKELNPNANDKYNYNAKYVPHALILSNEEFGDIYINDVDFIEINKIIEVFEEMRLVASVKLRSQRLTKEKK